MSRHEFVTVSLRLLGLICLLLAVPRIAAQLTALVQTLSWLHWQVQHLWENLVGAMDNFGLSLGEAIVAILQTAFGLYLLLGGRRLRRLIARMDDGRCLTCGYDLQGNGPGAKCPECGTPGESGGPRG